ncbi:MULTISPECIES: penicillin acylase family protein [unclassified Streptomyces]|uniref:penicillin acylase family protein n=1 Tax=Streptomyces TaxID=1883 RepID=UPI0001C194D5|nr:MULTISPECIES: penicillin acylase family protein [unclassified Streptomyces]AEN10531.1 peptidase S45 penicillin amidase [Streptomyces sp. SirexAA-E]MYR70069.1 penicillin acylase family protein [Streptomyces sp. SID4939]MYS03078.1 penicillin acylase family protein [Streptomyces sp. SID4940]MYT62281.1 penicillin acylase family protein [Streptomyces sp. SID8357]MYT83923.1 penicillin acylase family protein [Streptomyces sp. SID8360]
MPANTTAPSGSSDAKKPGRKKGRRARLLVIVLVLALVAGVGYGAYWSVSTVRASYPQTTGTLELKGLTGDVDVKRDDYGIPQIYADSDADLFRAQGFVQAQDRFWEMDVRRHMTSGRLSEMFGSDQVDTDAFLRTLGWRKVAQEEYDKVLDEDTKKNLQAYAEGVNAYLAGKDGKDISVEYAALGLTNDYKPTEWTPVDSVAWLKAMAWDLRGNMQDEIDRSLLTSRLSEKQIEDLYPEYPYKKNRPIVDQGAVSPVTGEFDPEAEPSDDIGGDTVAGATDGLNTQLSALSDTLDEIPALLGPNGNGIGSNSWVVSGAHTTTGKPLLANDPHLAPMLPSLWYQMGLHCREVSKTCRYDTAGYTFSGMPGVIIGHNQDIAWGFTNLGADVTDLFLEKVSADGYQYDGKTEPFVTREETIKVAGGKSRKITVRETNNGPLVSDRSSEMEKVGKRAPVTNSAPDRGDGYAIALKWTALDPGKSMDAVFELNRAKDFKTFRAAAEHFEVPSQNLIYADTEGNIGYQAPGKIPVRLNGDGTMPSPGWSSKYGWEKDPIPFDELPYEYNPERGYIVTANQAVIDDSYKHMLTKDWGYGARSQRINDLIQKKIDDGGKVSTDDMQSMQMDNQSAIAAKLVPKLVKIGISDKSVREAQKLLEGWDYTQESDSAAAAYFNGVWRNILKLAFGNKLPKELRPKGECLNVRPAAGTGPVDEQNKLVRECGQRDPDTAQPDGGDRWYEVVESILDDTDNEWWKVPAQGREEAIDNRDQLFARAMEDARWELTAKLGKDISTWNWGRLHQLTLRNQTLGTEGPDLLQRALNRGPWNLGGGEAAVNATGWNAAGGYGVIWVPSMRMVVNVGDWDKSRWINLTGASGHAFSAHYTDQTDKWADGELLDWSYGKGAVDKSTVDTLTLKKP